jgi:[ribosomal protein S5]-alanine N-acetyltransferase
VTLPVDETIVTDRLLLRHPRAEDIPRTWSATRIPGFNDGMRWEPPERIEELEEQHAKNVAAWRDGRWYAFAIERRADGVVLGRVSLTREEGDGRWSLGFWIHPDAQGAGYAREAAAALIDFGFRRLCATAILASFAEWNEASRRVLAHLGFRHLCTDPGFHLKKGKPPAALETYVLER